jgi:hypothetical protein
MIVVRLLRKAIFWLLFPLMLLLGLVWWREDTAFIIHNLYLAIVGVDMRRGW